ncbi:transmembrane protein 45A-like [Mus pahari]|uniref:transmembrane protein 45A-like n=1 Tax=Mus pahari TaxID=10093 RepID=UPI000A308ED6|nr:transmembrane protein 45A-like [Mus pahari]
MNGSGARIGPSHPKVSGDAEGHILPGLFLVTLGLWWSTKSILKYICKQQKRFSFLITPQFLSRAEILEGIAIIVVVLVAMTGQFYWIVNVKPSPHKEMQEDQIRNWQHVIIYVVLAMLGVIKILCFTISSLPVSLITLMLSNSFFVEAFLIHNHPKSLMVVDSYVHQLVKFTALLAGLTAFIEFLLAKNNVVMELLRSSLTMLQGACLAQIGFILYPKDMEHAWDLNDVNNTAILSIYFGVYYASTYVIIGVNYVLVSWFIKWKLSKVYPSEIQFLKNYEQQEDSEDGM